MQHTTENAALTMRWTPETDASGRTRLVAHWVPAGQVETASRVTTATIVEAA